MDALVNRSKLNLPCWHHVAKRLSSPPYLGFSMAVEGRMWQERGKRDVTLRYSLIHLLGPLDLRGVIKPTFVMLQED